ncbi:MAG: hypothetical protein ABL883_08885 [Terricaulis sp.]
MDAGGWSVTFAVFAAIAGSGLAIAAIALWRRADQLSGLEFDGGYNALAPAVDH